MSSTRWVTTETTQDAPERAQEHREGFHCHGNAKVSGNLETSAGWALVPAAGSVSSWEEADGPKP